MKKRKKPIKTNGLAKSIIGGTKFGYWTVIRLGEKVDYLFCKCACGTTKAVNVYSLTSGKSKSCGCLSIKVRKKTQVTNNEG